jgi:flagellin-like protein
MLKRILTQKRYFKNIYKEQKGITGLETAIILIAFVVVAAVFAYTVLSAGLFSTQKSQEAVYSGLQETQNTMEVKGGVLSQAVPKAADSCDDIATTFAAADTGATSITQNTTAADLHEGSGSLDVLVKAAGANGDELAHSAAAVTVAAGDTVTFWAKLGNTALNMVSVGLATDDDISAGVDHLAISATDTSWHLYTMTVTDAGARYYGGFLTGAGAAQHVFIDDIQVNNVSLWQSTYNWTPYASYIKLTLALASTGTPIDFSPGTTNTAGVWTGTKTNKMVVNYNDAYSHVTDVAWTAVWIGNNNGDYMLDPGEKIQLTVDLTAPNAIAKVDANHQFTLECKTPKGAILSLQRTMPARLYGIDNLY